jgi:hypothetical protein
MMYHVQQKTIEEVGFLSKHRKQQGLTGALLQAFLALLVANNVEVAHIALHLQNFLQLQYSSQVCFFPYVYSDILSQHQIRMLLLGFLAQVYNNTTQL